MGGLVAPPVLGVLGIDYTYEPAPGDAAHPDSYCIETLHFRVDGLTFEMCQSGVMTEDVRDNFLDAVRWLEDQGVAGITGDCGFLMYFQDLARTATRLPIFLSSLIQLPFVTATLEDNAQVAIFTANGSTFHHQAMQEVLVKQCGNTLAARRYVIVGCEDVPGFDAVANGEKVDTAKVEPGMVAKAKAVLAKHHRIQAFLFECTELPPYSNAVREATGLPVLDCVTCAESLMHACLENPRFGRRGWQAPTGRKMQRMTLPAGPSSNEKVHMMTQPPCRPISGVEKQRSESTLAMAADGGTMQTNRDFDERKSKQT